MSTSESDNERDPEKSETESGESQGDAAESSRPARRPPSSLRWLVLLVALTLVAYVIMGQVQGPARGTAHQGVGATVTVLQLEPLTGDGSPQTTAELVGNVTLINYWGTWCPPCHVEFPHLMELHAKYREQERFRFLSVSCNDQPGLERETLEEMTREFLEKRDADLVTYADPQGTSRKGLMEAAQMQAFAFPMTVVLDRHAVIRGVWVGYRRGYEDEMDALLASLLSE